MRPKGSIDAASFPRRPRIPVRAFRLNVTHLAPTALPPRLAELASITNEKAIDDNFEVCNGIALHQEMVKSGSRRGAPQSLTRGRMGDEGCGVRPRLAL